MQGIVILLTGEPAEAFARLQEESAAEFGQRLLPAGHISHVTLHLAAQYELASLDRAVKCIARSESPFVIRTEGFGFFTGAEPLAHWPVARTARLSLLQRILGQEVSPSVTSGLSEYCDADRWMPHVTLGSAPGAPFVARLAPWLLARSPSFEIAVNELVIAEDTPEGTRILSRHKLEG